MQKRTCIARTGWILIVGNPKKCPSAIGSATNQCYFRNFEFLTKQFFSNNFSSDHDTTFILTPLYFSRQGASKYVYDDLKRSI